MKKTNSYDLFPLLINNFVAWLKTHIVKYESLEFPKEINGFVFYSNIKKIGPRKSYNLALYKNDKGKKAVAKMKDARIKGYHYYSLLNEIAVYQILNKALERVGAKIPPKFKNIFIPTMLCKYEDENLLILLVEFVEGQTAEDLSSEEKITIYFKIIDFLNFIGSKLTKVERERISKRTPLHYLLLYPLLVVKSIFTYPNSAPYVLSGIPIFIKCLPAIFNDSRKTLVHRDLHFMNIIVSNNNLFLVDLQQCVYTEPLHELITTLRYWWKGWKNERFGKLLYAEIIKRNSGRKNFKKLFQAFTINSVTHGLTGAGFSKKIINGWLDFMKLGMNPNFRKYQK